MADEKKIPATPVPAATVLLIRDTDEGSRCLWWSAAIVCTLRPHWFSRAVSSTRKTPDRLSRCDGIAGLSTEEAALRIAGVRETFEECGVNSSVIRVSTRCCKAMRRKRSTTSIIPR